MKARCTVLIAAAVLGCRVHHVERDPAPLVEVPAAFAHGREGRIGPEPWWKAFDDPELDRLMDLALLGSMNLASAWARLDQARAVAEQAGAGWWPTVTAGANYGRSRSVFFPGGGFGKLTNTANNYDLSLAASYEVDAWAAVASGVDAAKLDRDAARLAVESLAMTVTAGVADTYFTIKELRTRLDLLRRQARTGRDYLDLVQNRFERGLVGAADVLEQKGQLESIEAQIPLIEARLEVAKNQLAVLLGKAPGKCVVQAAPGIPDPPPLPPSGVPASLVGSRPDLKAARLRVIAADHRIGAAIAARLPGFTLTASTGFRAQSLQDLFASWIYNLGAGLAAMIWDGGRQAAEVERAEAVRRELIATWSQAVLDALEEVEDALVREARQAEHVDAVRSRLDTARSALELVTRRYTEGLAEYTRVLAALVQAQSLEQDLVTARRQLLSYRIQLCRALGGPWTAAVEPPDGSRKRSREESPSPAKEEAPDE